VRYQDAFDDDVTDADAKVHWAETVDKPRYLQFTISGEPLGILVEGQKYLYELAL
jgi:hypothetical protein